MVSWRGWAGGLLLGAASVLMAACGGGGGTPEGAAAANGGGGSSGFSVSFDRSSVAMRYTQGDSTTASVVATAHGTSPGTVYISATTPSGQPDPNIDHVSDPVRAGASATVTVVPKANLAAGNYSGTIVLQVCADAACNKHFSGSPFNLAYTLTVTGIIRLSETAQPPAGSSGKLTVTSPRGDRFPYWIELNGDAQTALSGQVTVDLPTGLRSYTASTRDSWATVDQVTPTSLRISVPARPAGTYFTDLTFVSGDTNLTVGITHYSNRRPMLLDSVRVDLSNASGLRPSTPTSVQVGIVRLAENATSFTVDCSSTPWLSASNFSASSFTLTAAALPAGRHVGSVQVLSGGDTLVLPVSIQVAPSAAGDHPLATSVSSLTLTAPVGGSSSSQAFGLVRPSWNPEVSATIAYISGAGWLKLRTGSDGDLLASADASALAKGNYTATITLTGTYPSVPVLLPVSLTVGDALAVPAAQNLLISAETSAAQLVGTIPVASNGASALTWTATSSTPWLRLTRSAGDLGTPIAFQIDTAAALALPGYTDAQAKVTINAQTANGTLAPVSASVTLRLELPEVHFTGPGTLLAGQPNEVFVRGRGFDRISDVASRLSVNGTTATSITRLSATAIKLQLPALAAGTRTVTLSNALGASTSASTLQVVAPQAHSAATLVTGGAPYAVLHDGLRRQVFVANQTLSTVQRWREQAGRWTADSLAVANLADIGLSPDGAWLLATERSGRLHLVDPVHLTISASYSASGPFYPAPTTGHGLAVTNDGKVWLAVGTGQNQMVGFDLRSRLFSLQQPAGLPALFEGGPWFEVSRNGERKITVPSASSDVASGLLYDDASAGVWRLNPAGLGYFYYSYNGLDDSGSRFLRLGTVYDSSFKRIGQVALPDAGWTDNAGVLSPDGQRLYVYAQGPDWFSPGASTLPRIYVFDTSGAAGAATLLPLLGSWTLQDSPTCHQATGADDCQRPAMNISADGRTLLVAGSVKLLVVPVPAVLPNVQAARAGKNMRLWMR